MRTLLGDQWRGEARDVLSDRVLNGALQGLPQSFASHLFISFLFASRFKDLENVMRLVRCWNDPTNESLLFFLDIKQEGFTI